MGESPSPSWGGWLRRSRGRVGALSYSSVSPRHGLALPTRSLRDHPPHEGEGEASCYFFVGRKGEKVMTVKVSRMCGRVCTCLVTKVPMSASFGSWNLASRSC
ncbi:hypothetical protein D3C72_2033720 [compost metagenome]